MGSIEKHRDRIKRGSDGVHRQIKEINGVKSTRDGVIDPNPNPEEALLAKEQGGEEEMPSAIRPAQTAASNRERVERLQREEEERAKREGFDKAA